MINGVRAPLARHRWHLVELAAWTGLAGDRTVAERAVSYAVDRPSTLVFDVLGGRVTVREKGVAWPPLPGSEPYYDQMRFRAEIYRRFIEDSLARFGDRDDGVLVVDLNDLHEGEPDVPTFAFQKERGSNRILLPDLDCIVLDFYQEEEFIDRIPFGSKKKRVVFVGSTTGDLPITARHLDERLNHRLDAALFFKSEPRVDFWLPAIVQCDSPDTEAAIRRLAVAGRRLTWQEQFTYRYLISMDGNGATCSRVSIAMRSHSVLLKYVSPYELYFFKGLVDGRHYLAVENHRDVLAVLDENQMDRDRRIVDAARDFAQRNLSRLATMRYTADLVTAYLRDFGTIRKMPSRRRPVVTIDMVARLIGGGHVWSDRGGRVVIPAGRHIAQVDLFVDGPIDRRDVKVAIAGVGSAPGARPGCEGVRHLSIRLGGKARWLYVLSGEIRREDGTITAIGGAEIARCTTKDIPVITEFAATLRPRWFHSLALYIGCAWTNP